MAGTPASTSYRSNCDGWLPLVTISIEKENREKSTTLEDAYGGRATGQYGPPVVVMGTQGENVLMRC